MDIRYSIHRQTLDLISWSCQWYLKSKILQIQLFEVVWNLASCRRFGESKKTTWSDWSFFPGQITILNLTRNNRTRGRRRHTDHRHGRFILLGMYYSLNVLATVATTLLAQDPFPRLELDNSQTLVPMRTPTLRTTPIMRTRAPLAVTTKWFSTHRNVMNEYSRRGISCGMNTVCDV